jgi:hypothetical protein
MNHSEFLGWLEGYIEAGGKDVERIREQAKKVSNYHINYTTNPYPPTLDDPPNSFYTLT